MSKVEFFLFRSHVTEDPQSWLFDRLSREDAISQVLLSGVRLSQEVGGSWHIGNVTFIDENGGYFAAGRRTQSKLEKIEEATGNFIEEPLETSPYTHVVFDRKIGLVAIARKSKLAPDAKSIARQISRLLGESEVMIKNGYSVDFKQILDPTDFISVLRSAYSIRSFEATFGRPNPPDIEELFQGCNQRLLEETHAEAGKTKIRGKSLAAEPLIRISVAIASTGNDAKARVNMEQDGPTIPKDLKGSPASFEIADQDFTPAVALAEAREVYRRIRGLGDGDPKD